MAAGLPSARRFGALREHDLETAMKLRVTGFFEGGQCLVLEQKLFATKLGLAANLAGFAHPQPAAEQVLLKGQRDVLGSFPGNGFLLEQQAHR